MVFTPAEEELIYRLAEKITGSSQQGTSRKTVIVHNILRRIQAHHADSLASYLEFALSNEKEYQQLLSALTIHYTNWFREADVFAPLYSEWSKQNVSGKPLRILSAACSSGEEVYSFALYLESMRKTYENFDYRFVGMDIDPVSVATAKRAIYPRDKASGIPLNLHRFLAYGSGKTKDYFTLDKEIRSRTNFFHGDLRNLASILSERQEKDFDIILCRNVLIYFDAKGIAQIVRNLSRQLLPGGILCVGHSEHIDLAETDLSSKGRSLYRKPLLKTMSSSTTSGAGRVLIVDDSLVIRRVLSSLIAKMGFEVESVESAMEASKAVLSKTYDLITLDLHMPQIDGITWLKEQRSIGLTTPVVIVSDASPAEAEDVLGILSTHAQDYIEKKDLQDNSSELTERLRAIADQTKAKTLAKSLFPQSKSVIRPDTWRRGMPELIVIGASTGGTEALVKMLGNLTQNSPPIVLVQHITPNFAEAFAHRLATASGLKLGKMIQDETLQRGHLYIALGDYHIAVKKQSAKYVLDISHGAKEHAVRPSIDLLFRSAARTKLKVLGCILTGMGKDGALGLLDIKNNQGMTLAQNEESCVVYGMPREAATIGAVQFVGDLAELRREIDGCILFSSSAA
ncbi:MAG: response regulator [Proteobacteria bacterium]|nr:MAG: response regulator [Pseudomonadota bacterium]